MAIAVRWVGVGNTEEMVGDGAGWSARTVGPREGMVIFSGTPWPK